MCEIFRLTGGPTWGIFALGIAASSSRLFAAIPPSPKASQTWASLLSQANSLDQAGHHKQASIKAEEALRLAREEKDPASEAVPRVASRLAGFYQSAGEWRRLDALARSLPAAPPQNRLASLQYVQVYEMDEDYSRARKALERALKTMPDDPDLLQELGKVFLNEERYREAVGALQRSLKHDPHNYTAYFYLGRAYQMLGDHSAAIKTYALARKANPKGALAYAAAGYAQLAFSGDSAVLRQFAADIPQEGLQHIGEFYLRSGRLDAALSTYQEALHAEKRRLGSKSESTGGRSGILLGMAEVYRKMGRRDRAVAAAKEALASARPGTIDWFDSLFELSGFYRNLQKSKEAVSYAKLGEDACGKNNDHPKDYCFGIFAQHAQMALSLGRRQQAESLYRSALAARSSHAEGDGYPFVICTMALADAAAALGHDGEAMRLYQSAASWGKAARTDRPPVLQLVTQALQGLARVYEKKGRLEDAAKARHQAELLQAPAEK